MSLMNNKLPSPLIIKIEDDSDDNNDNDCVIVENTTKKWEDEEVIRQMQLRCFYDGVDLKTMIKSYILTLTHIVSLKTRTEIQRKLLKHVFYFRRYYEESKQHFVNLDDILDSLETLLNIFINVELETVRSTKMKSRPVLEAIAGKILRIMKIVTDYNYANGIHVLLKLPELQRNPNGREVLRIVFNHYLLTLPRPNENTDMDFLRHYLLMVKYKKCLSNAEDVEEHKMLDREIETRFNRDLSYIEKSEVLRQFCVPQFNPVYRPEQCVMDYVALSVSTYFRFISDQKRDFENSPFIYKESNVNFTRMEDLDAALCTISKTWHDDDDDKQTTTLKDNYDDFKDEDYYVQSTIKTILDSYKDIMIITLLDEMEITHIERQLVPRTECTRTRRLSEPTILSSIRGFDYDNFKLPSATTSMDTEDVRPIPSSSYFSSLDNLHILCPRTRTTPIKTSSSESATNETSTVVAAAVTAPTVTPSVETPDVSTTVVETLDDSTSVVETSVPMSVEETEILSPVSEINAIKTSTSETTSVVTQSNNITDATTPPVETTQTTPPADITTNIETVAVESAAAKTISVETVVVNTAPVETVAAKAVPTKTVAVETVPVETVAVETVAVETVPVETVAVKAVPAKTVAVERVAVETVSVETVPVETVAVETVPVETVAVETCATQTSTENEVSLNTISSLVEPSKIMETDTATTTITTAAIEIIPKKCENCGHSSIASIPLSVEVKQQGFECSQEEPKTSTDQVEPLRVTEPKKSPSLPSHSILKKSKDTHSPNRTIQDPIEEVRIFEPDNDEITVETEETVGEEEPEEIETCQVEEIIETEILSQEDINKQAYAFVLGENLMGVDGENVEDLLIDNGLLTTPDGDELTLIATRRSSVDAGGDHLDNIKEECGEFLNFDDANALTVLKQGSKRKLQEDDYDRPNKKKMDKVTVLSNILVNEDDNVEDDEEDVITNLEEEIIYSTEYMSIKDDSDVFHINSPTVDRLDNSTLKEADEQLPGEQYYNKYIVPLGSLASDDDKLQDAESIDETHQVEFLIPDSSPPTLEVQQPIEHCYAENITMPKLSRSAPTLPEETSASAVTAPPLMSTRTHRRRQKSPESDDEDQDPRKKRRSPGNKRDEENERKEEEKNERVHASINVKDHIGKVGAPKPEIKKLNLELAALQQEKNIGDSDKVMYTSKQVPLAAFSNFEIENLSEIHGSVSDDDGMSGPITTNIACRKNSDFNINGNSNEAFNLFEPMVENCSPSGSAPKLLSRVMELGANESDSMDSEGSGRAMFNGSVQKKASVRPPLRTDYISIPGLVKPVPTVPPIIMKRNSHPTARKHTSMKRVKFQNAAYVREFKKRPEEDSWHIEREFPLRSSYNYERMRISIHETVDRHGISRDDHKLFDQCPVIRLENAVVGRLCHQENKKELASRCIHSTKTSRIQQRIFKDGNKILGGLSTNTDSFVAETGRTEDLNNTSIASQRSAEMLSLRSFEEVFSDLQRVASIDLPYTESFSSSIPPITTSRVITEPPVTATETYSTTTISTHHTDLKVHMSGSTFQYLGVPIQPAIVPPVSVALSTDNTKLVTNTPFVRIETQISASSIANTSVSGFPQYVEPKVSLPSGAKFSLLSAKTDPSATPYAQTIDSKPSTSSESYSQPGEIKSSTISDTTVMVAKNMLISSSPLHAAEAFLPAEIVVTTETLPSSTHYHLSSVSGSALVTKTVKLPSAIYTPFVEAKTHPRTTDSQLPTFETQSCSNSDIQYVTPEVRSVATPNLPTLSQYAQSLRNSESRFITKGKFSFEDDTVQNAAAAAVTYESICEEILKDDPAMCNKNLQPRPLDGGNAHISLGSIPGSSSNMHITAIAAVQKMQNISASRSKSYHRISSNDRAYVASLDSYNYQQNLTATTAPNEAMLNKFHAASSKTGAKRKIMAMKKPHGKLIYTQQTDKNTLASTCMNVLNLSLPPTINPQVPTEETDFSDPQDEFTLPNADTLVQHLSDDGKIQESGASLRHNLKNFDLLSNNSNFVNEKGQPSSNMHGNFYENAPLAAMHASQCATPGIPRNMNLPTEETNFYENPNLAELVKSCSNQAPGLSCGMKLPSEDANFYENAMIDNYADVNMQCAARSFPENKIDEMSLMTAGPESSNISGSSKQRTLTESDLEDLVKTYKTNQSNDEVLPIKKRMSAKIIPPDTKQPQETECYPAQHMMNIADLQAAYQLSPESFTTAESNHELYTTSTPKYLTSETYPPESSFNKTFKTAAERKELPMMPPLLPTTIYYQNPPDPTSSLATSIRTNHMTYHPTMVNYAMPSTSNESVTFTSNQAEAFSNFAGNFANSVVPPQQSTSVPVQQRTSYRRSSARITEEKPKKKTRSTSQKGRTYKYQ